MGGAGASEAERPKWTTIHGRHVDVSKFRHPGGNIIELFYGMDSTSAFEQFHGHHKGAWKMLKALPTKEVDPADVPQQPQEHVAEMTRLMTSWRERGLFKPRPVASGIYGLAVVAAIVACIACAPHAPVLSGIGLGSCWAQCGFLQHMGGHREWGVRYSFLLQHFFEGLLKGGSASWWRNRHNKHHAKTNVLGEDGDLRTTPFFAWDPTLAKKVPDWSLKTQAFTFLPALGAYVFVFAFTIRKYAVACHPPSPSGIYLGFFFGLSHFAVERVPSTATWLESSMIGTVDWGGSSAFCGYASAEKLGLPYRELSFAGAVKLMMVGLWRTGRDELQLRSDRRKYSRTQAYMAAASAVVENLKAD
ncbi:hypothetical protein EMIHUDRAFT_433467 [Emiliania huxleyi CCMP1516]|uniref:Fatty acid desaturase domain-containing protein n=2 Tax=Emiliania huxleyi TaxID=2903 RepID=A0A0D3KV71_EMIH1|nr:hypothetical protein EMIHUDRAFT_433467 [Emiliania huxleyi CCMP1516]EOD39656.1 hypothetical protein EMIHUDRAFT_433467 [Emiliania huxleyi CCMP1516]|eukprot:XP_005792085.1 hypothetical protein EMIHUDRAFT_433467 [Emiliania huxleyi CCMP1516]